MTPPEYGRARQIFLKRRAAESLTLHQTIEAARCHCGSRPFWRRSRQRRVDNAVPRASYPWFRTCLIQTGAKPREARPGGWESASEKNRKACGAESRGKERKAQQSGCNRTCVPVCDPPRVWASTTNFFAEKVSGVLTPIPNYRSRPLPFRLKTILAQESTETCGQRRPKNQTLRGPLLRRTQRPAWSCPT